MKKEARYEILRRLHEVYGDPRPELVYGTPFELLVAVILSAQCTDKRVNVVTGELFQKYNTPEGFAALQPDKLEPMIRSCGLGGSKAKNIVNTARILLSEYGGELPRTVDELQKLPGVGRKTANVVASVAFGVPAIAVDTHVLRVSNRLGLARSDNPSAVEKQLMTRIPKEQWSMAHHWLIFHGRRVCCARSARCADCFLNDLCEYTGKKGN